MTNPNPPADLTDALTKHYSDLYRLGRQTVAVELQKQRVALKKTLAAPDDTAAALGARAARARARGEHSARNILTQTQQVLGRAQITGLQDPATLQKTAEAAATAQLRVEALANTTAMINDGRYDEASSQSDVVGGYYTSCMDERSCDPCVTADDGTLLSPDDAVALGPPNPDCEGGDKCRCTIVWVLSDDPAALSAVT